LDIARHRDVGHALHAEIEQLDRIRSLGISLEYQAHEYLILAALVSFDRHRSDFGNAWIVAQHRFDLVRGDVLATASNRILDAIDVPQVAALVQAPGISGMKPEVAPGVDRALRHAVIALHEAEGLLRPHQNLAHGADRQRLVRLGIGDNHLEKLVPDLARAAGFIRRLERARHRQVALGHAEQLSELRDPEALA